MTRRPLDDDASRRADGNPSGLGIDDITFLDDGRISFRATVVTSPRTVGPAAPV